MVFKPVVLTVPHAGAPTTSVHAATKRGIVRRELGEQDK